jgi:uncharacterized protein (DUF1684 family)
MDFHLLDYRRQVLELYRAIRQIGVDQLVSFVLFKETRDNLFKNHSQSLLPQKERERFVKLSYYDYNSNYKAKVARYTELDPQQIVSVRVGERNNTNGSANSNGSGKSLLTADSSTTTVSSTTLYPSPIPSHPNPSTSSAESVLLLQIGRVNFKLFNQDWVLSVFRTPGGGLLIPFRDPTNGVTTYSGGRYLYHTCEGADLGSSINSNNGSVLLTLDFNYAYNPPRCYNELLGSLVPLQENNLNIKIEAGEKLYWERNGL